MRLPMLRRLGALVALLFLSAASARAQGVGAINGTAADSSGAVLPGVTVTLTLGGGGVGSGQTAVTNEQGVYQFTRLVPGLYSVAAELAGFKSVELRGITVNSDQVARADFKLELGAVQESITVSGQSPVIDTSSGVRQTVISNEVLDRLPNRTDVWSISRVIPGVVLNKLDVGGSEQFLQSSAAVRGTATENKFMIDGMDVSALDGNATIAALYLDPYAFQETNFMTGAGSAESPNGGLTFNMITRSGTNALRGGAMYNGTWPALANTKNFTDAMEAQLMSAVPPVVLQANPNIDPNANIQTMYDAGGWVSGPVLRDQLWFAGTYHKQRLDSYKLGSYNPDGTQVIDDNDMWTVTAKATWQINRASQLSYFYNLQYKLIGHRGGGTFADSRARNYNDKYPTVNQVKYNTTIGSNKVFDVTYSRFRADDAFGSRPEVSPGDIAAFDTTSQISAVALPTYRAIGMFRDQVRTTFSWFLGKHDLKGGYEFVYATRTARFWSTSGLRANFANGVPTSVNTYLVQVTQSDTTYGADIDELFRYRANEQGLFIQDRWTPTRKLVLNLGLRWDTSSSYQPGTCRPVTEFAPEQCYDQVTAPSFRDLAPRFNLIYDLTGDGRTALKFAANRYNQPVNISIIERLNPVVVGNNVTSDQRTWNDANRDLIPQPGEIGPSPGYVFVGANGRYADDLNRPVANEYTVELQRELPQNIVISGGYTYRQQRRNIGEIDTVQTLESWGAPITVTEVTSGEVVEVWRRGTANSARLFYNAEEMNLDYQGGDLTLNKRLSNRWALLAGASWGRVTSPTRGGVRSDPHILSYFDGETLAEADRPWSYRVSGSYQLPWDVMASGTWQYQIGGPEDTTVVVTNRTITLPQGNQTLRVRPYGNTRLGKVASLDLTFRKSFRVGTSTISPRLDIFNATNEATVTARVTQLGPSYSNLSGIQRGRLIKLGLNLDF